MGEGQPRKSSDVKVMSTNVCETSNIFFPSYGLLRECVWVGGEAGAPMFQLLLLLCTAANLHSKPYPPSRLPLCSRSPALCMPTEPSLGEGCFIPMVALGLLVWHKL